MLTGQQLAYDVLYGRLEDGSIRGSSPHFVSLRCGDPRSGKAPDLTESEHPALLSLLCRWEGGWCDVDSEPALPFAAGVSHPGVEKPQ